MNAPTSFGSAVPIFAWLITRFCRVFSAVNKVCARIAAPVSLDISVPPHQTDASCVSLVSKKVNACASQKGQHCVPLFFARRCAYPVFVEGAHSRPHANTQAAAYVIARAVGRYCLQWKRANRAVSSHHLWCACWLYVGLV